MDDVDAVQAQIARNMLTSGDWVTARLDGVAYLEKSPLIYWMMAVSYELFGVHDWAARIPVALSSIGLCWLTAAFGVWAFGKRAGFYAGLVHGHLRRTVPLHAHPDSRRDADISRSRWPCGPSCARSTTRSRIRALWACVMAASLGIGLLLKSLIGGCVSRRPRR